MEHHIATVAVADHSGYGHTSMSRRHAFTRPVVGATLAVLAAIGLAACYGDAAQAADLEATNQVVLARSYRFEPATISIAVGTTVTWTNQDQFSHTVRLLDDGGAVLPLEPREQVTHTFAAAGVFRYDCSLHPQNMRGTVVVTDDAPSRDAPAGQPGRY